MTNNIKAMRFTIKCIVVLTVILLCLNQIVWAQDFSVRVPVVFSENNSFALLDIESLGDKSLEFSITPSSEAGASPVMQYDANKVLWLNYTSLIESSLRSIKAKIDGGGLPEGLSLKVQASSFIGAGEGTLGQPVGQIELTEQDKTIITGVGNCYTGDGVGNGHSLTFSLEVNDFSNLSSNNSSSITILYTIIEN